MQGSRAKTKRGPPKYHMPTGGANLTKTEDLMEIRESYTVDTRPGSLSFCVTIICLEIWNRELPWENQRYFLFQISHDQKEMGQSSTKTNACTYHFLLPPCHVTPAVTLWRASAKCSRSCRVTKSLSDAMLQRSGV